MLSWQPFVIKRVGILVEENNYQLRNDTNAFQEMFMK